MMSKAAVWMVMTHIFFCVRERPCKLVFSGDPEDGSRKKTGGDGGIHFFAVSKPFSQSDNATTWRNDH